MRSIKFILFILSFSLLFNLNISSLSLADTVSTDGLYSTVTDDNVTLKMKRYRPEPDASFNENGQPVLLMPGLFNSLNEFLTKTPEEREDNYGDMDLGVDIAEWAEGDIYIQEDPMKYYSIAHYLWLKGYDPWLGNYRGTGRGEFESDRGRVLVNLDVWSALDVPAFIKRIFQVTGKYPVIGGHSSGGLVSYCYLQGIYFDKNDLGKNYITHIKFDPALAAQRNRQIKGFLGLDPASIFPMSPGVIKTLNNLLVWKLLSKPLYVNLDSAMARLLPLIDDPVDMAKSVNMVFGTISNLALIFPAYLPEYRNIFKYLNCWNVKNTHPYVEDFVARYAVSSSYMGVVSQYFDAMINGQLREHYQNGVENKARTKGPAPKPGWDGYYYYGPHMYLMSVPTLLMLSESDSIVEAEQTIAFIISKKTSNVNDEWYVVPGTAHIDLPIGYNAPTFTFPKVGEWLDKICP